MLLLLLACDPAPDPTPAGVTWTEDVQPLVAVHCARCHAPGGLSSIPMSTYQDAVLISGPMAESVAERRMPPFIAENSGTCQTYNDALWLTEAEQALFVDWHEGGALEGPELEPTQVIRVEGLEDPTATLSSPEPYTPDHSSGDDWRCFVVEANTGETTRYLQAYEVIPERPERVHHVTLFKPINDSAVAAVRARDQGSGYTCFGDAGAPAALVGVWSPGRRTYHYPENSGVALEAGRPLVMQVHYVPDEATDVASTTSVAVRMVDSVEKEILPLWLLNDDFYLQGGTAREEDPHEGTLREALDEFGLQEVQGELEIVGTAGHMHLLGSSIHAEIVHEDGSRDCLLDIPRWDYGWHDVFLLERPFMANTSDRIELDCSWNTAGVEGPIVWGDGVEEEMCVLLVLALVDPL